MSGIIDFHSHVLPGIDDGSASLEESIGMLREEAAQGISHVIATPHFYARYDNPEQFLEARKQAQKQLCSELKAHSGLPEITVGAEVHFFPGISHSDVLEGLTIGKNRCILIEMPESVWTDRMYQELEDLALRQGLIPIVAHVDRYISPFRTRGIPERLAELPVLVQANASFFLRSSTRSLALKLLKQDKIHLLGSDCHNLTTRPPMLGDAVEVIRQKLGEKALARIRYYQEELLTE
ncbi:MAG: capsular polysaccharide biosynthesis protein [Oscillospiraceae bacterium]|nr:capsular polysaccharide biosynthesis protein [Oscillospiraceae bacterium]